MSGRTRFLPFFFFAYWRDRSHVRGRGKMKQIPALMTWHRVLFSLPVPFLDAAIYVHGCAMPWCVPRGALLIECSEQHAVSMPSLGVNVVPIRAPILMLAQTRKNKKETSRRTDSAQSHMQQFCLTARVQPLVRWHRHSLVSTHSIGKNLDYALAAVCGSMHASSHLCVGMGIRLCKIRRRTHLSPNSILTTTKWEMSEPQLSQKL